MTTQTPIDEALAWFERQGDAHFGKTGTLYRSALAKLSERRVDPEPATLEWFAEHVDLLAARLAKQETIQASSLKTYISRAKTAVAAYQNWSQNPVGFSPKSRKPSPPKREASTKALAGAGAPAAATQEPSHAPASPPQPGEPRTLDTEISEALVAISRWPLLRPFLMQGLSEAMGKAKKD